MVRYAAILGICMSAILLTSVSYKKPDTKSVKKYCRGYSVIAVDKGIDCAGDYLLRSRDWIVEKKKRHLRYW